MSLSLGPVEYIVIGFPGNKFKGDILPALGDLVKNGTIRVMDLAFVSKDADGSVLAFELEDLATEEAEAFAFEKEVGDLLGEEDLSSLPTNSNPILRRRCWYGRTSGPGTSRRPSLKLTASWWTTPAYRTKRCRPLSTRRRRSKD